MYLTLIIFNVDYLKEMWKGNKGCYEGLLLFNNREK